MLTGKKVKVLLAMLLSLVVMAQIAAPVTVDAASSKAQIEKRLSDLKKKESDLKNKIAKSKNKIEEQEGYKADLDEQIKVVQDQVDTLNEQIEVLDAEIVEKSGEISEHEQSINENEEQLKERLRALYIAGDTSNIAILLGAEDLSDMFNKADVMQRVAEHDRSLINDLKETKAAIEGQLATIQEDRDTVAAARKEVSKKESQLSELIAESNRVIQNLEAAKAANEEEQKKVHADMEAAEDEMDAWMKEYYRKQEEERKKQQNNNKDNNNNNNNTSNSPYKNGDFNWPVPGYYKVSSGFKWRWGRMHNGIDIAGGGIYGANIVAAADGKVVKARTYDNGGYGLHLYVDHGNGYMTIYGHCSKLLVGNGEYVKKGQVIAKVGNSGRSTGPHLHFEIRVNGTAKNPMNWF